MKFVVVAIAGEDALVEDEAHARNLLQDLVVKIKLLLEVQDGEETDARIHEVKVDLCNGTWRGEAVSVLRKFILENESDICQFSLTSKQLHSLIVTSQQQVEEPFDDAETDSDLSNNFESQLPW